MSRHGAALGEPPDYRWRAVRLVIVLAEMIFGDAKFAPSPSPSPSPSPGPGAWPDDERKLGTANPLRGAGLHPRPAAARTYVEIGVNRGNSLTLALPGTRVVGIDPEPRLRHPISRSHQGVSVGQRHLLRALGPPGGAGRAKGRPRLHRRHAPVRVRAARLRKPGAPLHVGVRRRPSRLPPRESARWRRESAPRRAGPATSGSLRSASGGTGPIFRWPCWTSPPAGSESSAASTRTQPSCTRSGARSCVSCCRWTSTRPREGRRRRIGCRGTGRPFVPCCRIGRIGAAAGAP